MGDIHSTVGQAAESANRQARELSLDTPDEIIMAVVTRDTGVGRLYLAWATTVQRMSANDTIAGEWKDGKKRKI